MYSLPVCVCVWVCVSLSCPCRHHNPRNSFSKITDSHSARRVTKVIHAPFLSFPALLSVTQLLEGTKCTSVIFCSNNSPTGIINFSPGPEQISVAFNGTLCLARTVTSLDLLFSLYEKLEWPNSASIFCACEDTKWVSCSQAGLDLAAVWEV